MADIPQTTSPTSINTQRTGRGDTLSPTSPTTARSASPSIASSTRKRDRIFAPFKTSSRTSLPLDSAEANDDPMTEAELREIFEEEEIQRFLNRFHANVGEVTLPSGGDHGHNDPNIIIVPPEDVKSVAQAGVPPASAAVELAPKSVVSELGPELQDESDSDSDAEAEDDSESSWVNVDKDDKKVLLPEGALPSKRGHVHAHRPDPVWGSELAAGLIVPLLPEGRAIEARNRRGGKHNKFSLGAMSVAGQRAYLSTYPFYVPLMLNLWDIARWIDWTKSARCCAVYWLLWWNNLLLPGFLFYIVYQLIRHRLLPYPTLEQLEARRQAILTAQSFGDAVTQVSSYSGLWKSSEGYSGLGSLALGVANATATAQANSENMKVTSMMKLAASAGKGALTGRFKKDKSLIDPEAKMSTVEGDRVLQGAEARQAAGWRRIGLLMVEELADMHERGKNLFLWRKPESSLMYTMVLFAAGFAVAFTPAHVLAKVTYAGLGFAYWFLIPVICAMTRKQRAMIPPPLFDIPTDSEYAMEIIARRLAQGESITPDKKHAQTLGEAYADRSKRDLALKNKSVTSFTGAGSRPMSPTSTIDMQMARNVKVEEMNVAVTNGDVEGYKLNGGGGLVGSPVAVNREKMLPEVPGEFPGTTTDAAPVLETQTYSAHHHHIPGIMSLSTEAIEFTPFLRNKIKVRIPLDRIRGVKKSGKRTLFIRYIEPAETDKKDPDPVHTVENPDPNVQAPVIVMTEKEDKFKWVGSRDEVFARIVATRKDHWVPV